MKDLLEAARSGRAVYVTDLHERFSRLGGDASERIVLVVEPLDGGPARHFDLKLPRLDRLDGEEGRLVEEYLQAETYNILSALGGTRLSIYHDRTRPGLSALAARIPEAFGIGLPRQARKGYGRCVNVIDRMMAALAPGLGGFSIALCDIGKLPPAAPRPPRSGNAVAVFRRRATGLGGKAILGVDVGGTDIKAVLVDDGHVIASKEYDWFPASFLRSRQLVEPICLLVRLFEARLRIHRLGKDDARYAELLAMAERGLSRHAGDAEMEAALAALAAAGLAGMGGAPGGPGAGGPPYQGLAASGFDGIGLCFPDVVVRDKIVGGEVYKTRGIRNNPAIDYEADFAELTGLDTRLRAWLRPGGSLRIINDGPMASFTAAVEMAASGGAPPEGAGVESGVFAHTLGTELGTGWVLEDGSIPDIPLEVYNFVIDLGSWPERAFEPDDARSLNNFNTGLPGTLQKYCSQSGAFRLALRYFPTQRPDLLAELVRKGFIEKRGQGEGEGWYVPTEPADMRKPFLEHLMALPDREGDEATGRIWREIGESLAVTSIETRRILEPATERRYLFGRLVKNPTCLALMQEGARAIDPRAELVAAGSGMANTPLMRELEAHPGLSVAQFAQAVGAVYFANGG
jgi:hypothetical protein